MRYSDEQLEDIFDRTDGYCHICGGKLCFSNYGQWGERGAWEVEHSNPQCNGGSNRLCNLYAAHISCNREKGVVSTRSARARNGFSKAPLSKKKKKQIRSRNRWGWGAAGAFSGAAVGGPVGFVVGGVLGALFGDDIKPE